jgi:hypothetical protein
MSAPLRFQKFWIEFFTFTVRASKLSSKQKGMAHGHARHTS